MTQGRVVYVCTNGLFMRKKMMDYLAATSEDVVHAEHIAARLRQTRPSARIPMIPNVVVAEAASDTPTEVPKKFRPLDEEIRDLEKRRIEEALAAHGGNQTRAAEAISMPLRTFVNKVRQYNLSPRTARK